MEEALLNLIMYRLVAEPGFDIMLGNWFSDFCLDYLDFISEMETINDIVQDTILDYILYFWTSTNTPMLTFPKFTDRHVLGFLDLFTDVSLKVQNKKYSSMLCMICYSIDGLHLWYT